MDLAFFIFLFITFILAIVLILILALSKSAESGRKLPAPKHYVSGEFSEQMQLDMRLPYRRFKQLYPSTQLTYMEYKNAQTRSAFRRSMSSQDNKRMVR